MNNLGKYEFSEESKIKIYKLAEITNCNEKFINDALRIISLKTFNAVLKNADNDVIEQLKKHAADQEIFQSYFRTRIPEEVVKKEYVAIHNNYIDGFIENCGGNYSDDVLDQIKKLAIEL